MDALNELATIPIDEAKARAEVRNRKLGPLIVDLKKSGRGEIDG